MSSIIDINNIPNMIDMLDSVVEVIMDLASEKIVEDVIDDLQSGVVTASKFPLSEFTKAERRAQGQPDGPAMHRSGDMARNLGFDTDLIGHIHTSSFGLPDTGAHNWIIGSPSVGVGPMRVGPYSTRGRVGEHGLRQPMSIRQRKWFWAQKRRLEGLGFLDPAAWDANRRTSRAGELTHHPRRWLSESMEMRLNEHADNFVVGINDLLKVLAV